MGKLIIEGLAAYWPTADDDTGFAVRTNQLPKYVASHTLNEPLTWNASLIRGDLTTSVAELKQRHPGNLISFGAGELAYELVSRGLVDEIHFWVDPSVWGDGERPFLGQRVRMQLVSATTFDSGVALLIYRPATADHAKGETS